MRVLGVIASVIMILVVLAAGMLLIWTAASEYNVETVRDVVYRLVTTDARLALGVVGLLFCLIVLARLVALVEPTKKKPDIVFASSLGEVRVAVDTLERYLGRVGSEIPDVQKLVPQVRGVDDGNRVTVDATVHVTLGRNVREVSEQIAEHIATQLKRVLGVTEVGNINVIVREVQPPETAG